MLLWWEIFLACAKVGIFGFGGGPSVIPLLQAEVVEAHHWLTKQEFVDSLAMANALPGPIATKMSGYVGFKLAGLPGAFVGVTGMILPSLIMILALATVFLAYKDSHAVKAMLKAVRPAVVALLVVTVWEIFPSSVTSWDTALIAVATFMAVVFLNVHPALAIMATAILGLFIY